MNPERLWRSLVEEWWRAYPSYSKVVGSNSGCLASLVALFLWSMVLAFWIATGALVLSILGMVPVYAFSRWLLKKSGLLAAVEDYRGKHRREAVRVQQDEDLPGASRDAEAGAEGEIGEGSPTQERGSDTDTDGVGVELGKT